MAFFALALAATQKRPLAAEPVMGVSTQAAFGSGVTEDDVLRTADLLESRGLLAAGYRYVLLDDGAVLWDRDENGKLQIDSARFPGGFPYIIDYVHGKNLLFGAYAAAGTATCAGGAGSFGNELNDAQQLAELGIDLLKYEFCNNPIQNAFYAPPLSAISVGYTMFFRPELRGGAYFENDWILGIGQGGEAFVSFPTGEWDHSRYVELRYRQNEEYGVAVVDINGEEHPLLTRRTSEGNTYSFVGFEQDMEKSTDYTYTVKNDYDERDLARFSFVLMAEALEKQERDIVFMVNEWGLNKPQEWAPEFAHMWRNSPDIVEAGNSCTWETILRNYEAVLALYEYSGESAHNDADLLCAGMAGISDTEAEAQISLWAMIGSPLVIGANVAALTDEQINILTNQYVRRVNQDKTHIQAIPVERDTDYDILLKPLDDGFAALLYFNKNDKQIDIAFDLSQMSNWFDFPAFVGAEKYHVLDAWTGAETDISAGNPMLSQRVDGHSAAFFIVTNKA